MSKFASSIENLVRRSSKQDSKVLSINILVEFYNALSLKHVVPFGGFDLQSELCEDMELRFSKEGDEFTSLDSEQKVAFPLGEAVYMYAYKNIVVTRQINWKQSKEGLI